MRREAGGFVYGRFTPDLSLFWVVPFCRIPPILPQGIGYEVFAFCSGRVSAFSGWRVGP